MSRLGSLTVVVALAGACVSVDPYMPGRSTWGEAKTKTDEMPEQPPNRTHDGRKVSAAELAAEMPSALECEHTARALFGHDADEGWELLKECAAATHMADFEVVLRKPWRDRIERPDGLPVLARMCARRGGDVGEDVRLLRSKGVDVFTLDEAAQDASSARHRPVLARGKVVEHSDLYGARTVELVETGLAGTTFTRIEGRGRSRRSVHYNDNIAVDNDRYIGVKLTERQRAPKVGEEVVVLFRFEGTSEEGLVDVEEDMSVGALIAHFPVGATKR